MATLLAHAAWDFAMRDPFEFAIHRVALLAVVAVHFTADGPPLAIDPLTMHLLSDPVVCEELALSDSERVLLAEVRREFAAELQAVTDEERRADAAGEGRQKLLAIKDRLLFQIQTLLGEHRVSRLRQLRWHALGLSAAFIDHNREELDIGVNQEKEYEVLAAALRRAEYDEFAKRKGTAEADHVRWLESYHWKLVADLDSRIAELLSAKQRERLHDLMGSRPSEPIRIFDAQHQYRIYAERMDRMQRVHPTPVQSFEALALDPRVQRLLNVTPEEAARIQQVIQPFVNSAPPVTSEAATQLTCTVLGHLNAILGKDRVTRLRQIHLQVRGPGALFGQYWRAQFHITSEQHRQATAAMSRVMPIEATRRSGSAAAPLGRNGSLRVRVDEELLKLLTPEQRAMWEASLGDKLPPELVEQIRRPPT